MTILTSTSSDGEVYQGPWHYNLQRGCWRGNPALAANVLNIYKGIKHKIAEDNNPRHHSLPMTYEIMEKTLAWSYSVCPPFDLEILSATSEEQRVQFIQLQLRAFMMAGFTVWTRHVTIYKTSSGCRTDIIYCRNDELSELRFGDIIFNCVGPAPYRTRHFRIILRNRKGWQKKIDKNQISALCML